MHDEIPMWCDIAILVTVAIGVLTIADLIRRRLPTSLHARLAVLAALCCIAFGCPFRLSSRHAPLIDPYSAAVFVFPAVGLALFLAVAVPVLATRRLGEHWEHRFWAAIAVGIVIQVPFALAQLLDRQTASVRSLATLAIVGIVLSAILILCRRSLKGRQEPRAWALIALALWPFCFLLGLLWYALTL
jgi:uncharacterized membrane protein